MGTKRSKSQRGHAVMEFALFLPYLFFTFVGAFDWGNYSWTLMKVEAAARVAALYTSGGSSTASDSSGACTYALGELSNASNLAGQSNCTGNLTVTATQVTGPRRQQSFTGHRVVSNPAAYPDSGTAGGANDNFAHGFDGVEVIDHEGAAWCSYSRIHSRGYPASFYIDFDRRDVAWNVDVSNPGVRH